MHRVAMTIVNFCSWLGLLEESFWFDKRNACRVQAAAICDSG
jgi:hypothetical protein